MNYGKRIKELREQAGMTQEQLGEALGITHSAVSLIESGKRGLNVKTADKIAHALGVTLNELLAESEG
jgi:XRE family transcriptional regulator, fatty acid utilization regulator